ncbi:hypothetical protein GGR32_002083 [Mesonia hippocampi]|uniref:Uncharacterized protein n=1 Tax=Mesonia hippocampi TaxID=1628250 RepID=A0A840EY72_9FLAO|nr:hypothetical protein [Mesonia hippocampi]MBB4119777.1 hypothetical protein [Mesonia hippocampi]
MKTSTKQGDYFINLPSLLYSDLKAVCKKDDSISFDLSALLVHLILTNKYADKDYKEGKKWIRLSAKILRENYDTTLYKSSKHLEILVENDIIEMQSHYHDPSGKNSRSRAYRINQSYFNIKESEITLFDMAFVIIPITESGIKKKCLKRIQQRKQTANLKVGHLTKWLTSDKFNFDKVAAIEFVDSKYPKHQSEKIKRRNEKRMFHIKNFESTLQIYSMEGRDNRLHSCFTALPSDLKQFVTFDDSPLKEADIKSSQPFILTIVLELIIKEYCKQINKKGYITVTHFTKRITRMLYKYLDDTIDNVIDVYIMCYYITSNVLIDIQTTDIKQIKQFVFLIRSGDIYEQVGKELFRSGAIWFEDGVYYTKLLKKDSDSQEIKDFETLRKCAKTITLNAIYCSPKTKAVRAVNEFRKLFPIVTKWLDALKKHNYSDLAVLMQQIESKAVLLHCSKKIAEKYPKLPLISRHDSLSTTVDNFDVLHSKYQVLLTDYFGVNVEVGKEDW